MQGFKFDGAHYGMNITKLLPNYTSSDENSLNENEHEEEKQTKRFTVRFKGTRKL